MARLASAPQRIGKILAALERAYPDARCTLNYSNPLELLVATILSAQCTDALVNKVTPDLFKKYRTAKAPNCQDCPLGSSLCPSYHVR
jgi:endonuclease-3